MVGSLVGMLSKYPEGLALDKGTSTTRGCNKGLHTLRGIMYGLSSRVEQFRSGNIFGWGA